MLRSLAQLRGRNVDWAAKAVRDAATLTAEDALKEGVIDVVARDIDELLTKIDGRKVTINAIEHKIATRGIAREAFEPDWRTRLLGVILRDKHGLDEMIAERAKINADVQRILDEQTGAWSIEVSNVELKHIDLNETMVRAIAKQAEAKARYFAQIEEPALAA